ncbi:N-formylglutamate amidohydrolase [Sphingomonas sp. Leaf343]|uniref:N-formylglutamate amidohydrolase n=1 Tax=Sphingomonas sp. Leaf343 TaxID=1736345 RepID=UPI001F452740|nr:N-formylglutamate amidohydrolase [Sphingomonas sp. Leaf343]
MDVQASPLFVAGDPPPVSVVNPGGASPFLFIGDHAGNVIPLSLGTLGLDDAERDRHIAWDIGVAGLGGRLAAAMDAAFVRQTYSRLVVDCNRRHDAPDAIAPISDGTVVPGNADLTGADRAARFAAIHEPYQTAIAAEIARRTAAGQPTILIALHSFTPVFGGVARPWQIGVLHDGGDAGFARGLLEVLRRDADLTVGDNEPYRMDLIDYTVPRHAYPAGLPYAELEVRQDLIADDTGQAAWAARLERVLLATSG